MSHLTCSNDFLPPLPFPYLPTSPSLSLCLAPFFCSACLYQLNSYAFPSIFFLLDCQMSITWLPAIVVVVLVLVGWVCLLFLLLKSFCGSHTHTLTYTRTRSHTISAPNCRTCDIKTLIFQHDADSAAYSILDISAATATLAQHKF